MDTVYVIYFDGRMYKNHNRKCAYLEIRGAKQVITTESKKIAEDLAKEDNKYYWDLDTRERKEYIEKAKKRFEIREFMERKE